MATWTDNFNRTNENPLAVPWTKLAGGNCILASNNVVEDAGGSSWYYYNTATPGANQYAQIKQSAGDAGPAVRMATAATTCYTLYENGASTAYKLVRFNAGADTDLIEDLPMPGSGVTIKLEVTGVGATVTLNVYYNNVLQDTYADTDAARIVAAGKIGFYLYGYNDLDDWEGGDLGGAVASKIIMANWI